MWKYCVLIHTSHQWQITRNLQCRIEDSHSTERHQRLYHILNQQTSVCYGQCLMAMVHLHTKLKLWLKCITTACYIICSLILRPSENLIVPLPIVILGWSGTIWGSLGQHFHSTRIVLLWKPLIDNPHGVIAMLKPILGNPSSKRIRKSRS